MANLLIKNLSVMLGAKQEKMLQLADMQLDRTAIKDKTGGIVAVHDINLTVNEAEFLVIMGLSGSGKSTLLKAIARLIPITRGEIIIEHNKQSYNLSKISNNKLQTQRKDLLAMVFQQFSLLPWRTVEQNISLGLEIAKIPKAKRTEIIKPYLELIGLTPFKDYNVTELSGGMQQRVGLARALVTNAPILLMDEPFSALDPLTRNHLQLELKNLQRKLKKTVIFVSHDLEEAVKLGDRIAIMKDGQIVQCGSPAQIILNPANDYVRNFTNNLNPLLILRAQDVMQPINSELKQNFYKVISHNVLLKDLLHMFIDSNALIGVSKNGKIIGAITVSSIIATLTQHVK